MKKKQIGIWMDHSIAVLMEFENDKIIQNIIEIEISQLEVEYDSGKNEKLKHNKENQQQSNFYKKISDCIKNYHEVVIFGPTDAKNELLNLLEVEHVFDKIKIEIIQSGKMSAIQMHDFVREYFK